MLNANDYVGLTTYPDPIDYDGCGYDFGDIIARNVNATEIVRGG